MPRLLGAATYSFLWRRSLEESLEALARLGFHQVEVLCSPPMVWPAYLGPEQRARLRRHAGDLGLELASLNAPSLDLNLASPNPDARAATVRHYLDLLDLAGDLGAASLVVVSGRLHQLLPAPREQARGWVEEGARRLVERAAERGVRVLLEAVPGGYCQTAAELVELSRATGAGVVLDVANAFMVEDPARALATAGGLIGLVHLSDTRRDRWLHASVGKGEVDFAAVARALDAIGYGGVSILETVEPEDAERLLAADVRALEPLGWHP